MAQKSQQMLTGGVSVIMPAYNAERYIGKCIKSVLAQTYKDFELIIVNDGSTDGTLHICQKFAEKDERIVLHNKKNGGEDMARYDGLQLARYEYVTLIDDDDFLPPNALKTLYNAAIANNVDMVMGNNKVTMFGGLVSVERKYSDEQTNRLMEHDEIMQNFYIGFFGKSVVNVALWAKLYRTSIIRKVFQPTGYRVGGDLVINMRIFPLLQSLYIVPDIVYHYRRGSGVTARFMPYWMENMKKLYLEKKKEMFAHDFVPQAEYYLKVELINCLRTYVEQFITFKPKTREENIAILQKELHDEIYKELNGVKYRDMDILDAIASRDAARLYAKMEDLSKHAPLKVKAKRVVYQLLRVLS